ncbi:MHC class II beta chain, partial [Clarias magur]
MRYVWFNSTVGEFQGATPYGIHNAERFNNDTATLEIMRAVLNDICKQNVRNFYPTTNEPT